MAIETNNPVVNKLVAIREYLYSKPDSDFRIFRDDKETVSSQRDGYWNSHNEIWVGTDSYTVEGLQVAMKRLLPEGLKPSGGSFEFTEECGEVVFGTYFLDENIPPEDLNGLNPSAEYRRRTVVRLFPNNYIAHHISSMASGKRKPLPPSRLSSDVLERYQSMPIDLQSVSLTQTKEEPKPSDATEKLDIKSTYADVEKPDLQEPSGSSNNSKSVLGFLGRIFKRKYA